MKKIVETTEKETRDFRLLYNMVYSLKDAIKTVTKRRLGWNETVFEKWMKDLRELANSRLDGDLKELDKVIAFYVENAKNPKQLEAAGLPTITNPKYLRRIKIFTWVYRKYKERYDSENPKEFEITPEVTGCLEDLHYQFIFPPKVESQLTSVVGECVQTYKKFLLLLWHVVFDEPSKSTDKHLQRAAEHFWFTQCTDPRTFTFNFVASNFDKLSGWDEWSGKLPRFKMYGKHMSKYAVKALYTYVGDKDMAWKYWNQLIDEMRKKASS
jgi:hypothetical protein